MRISALGVFACVMTAGAADVRYTISTVAGGAYSGDNRSAVQAQLGSPDGVAADAAGNVYVSDSIDHRVRKISPSGLITTAVGNGHFGFRGDGGPADSAQLNAPYGIALDRDGNLYIADLGNSRVRKVSASDGTIRTVAGGGTNPANAEGGDATAARLNQPRNLALDASGNLYIADFGDHRIYRVTPAGLIYRFAGVGTPGAIKDSAAVDAAFAPLDAPAGLAVDRDGAVYVADSGNRRIRKIYHGVMTNVALGTVALSTPCGISIDSSGNLYIADKSAPNVWRLRLGIAYPVAGSQTFTAPRDVAPDGAGNLYVGDGAAAGGAGFLRRVSPAGKASTIAGDGTFRALGDGLPATLAHMDTPTAVVTAASGDLYIADRQNRRIRRVSAGLISTFVQSGVGTPAGLALGAGGTLYVANSSDSRIQKVAPGGAISTVAGGQQGYAGDGGKAELAALNWPGSVAPFDRALYVADTYNHVVRKIDADGIITTVAGKGVRGYAGDGGPAASALLNTPSGIALDPVGNLYIADSGNHAIRRVARNGAISTVAGTGYAWFGGDGGPAATAFLQTPTRIALDRDGNLYIADTDNHRIRRVDADGVIRTIAGTGEPGFGGDGGPALAAQLREPVDVALDEDGNVFITDRANNCIRKLTPAVDAPPAEVVGVASVVNGASMLAGPVAPGEIVTLFGFGIGPAAGVTAQRDDAGRLPVALGATEVLFDGMPAPLLYAQFTQVNLQAPYAISGQLNTEVEIRHNGLTVARMIVPVVESAPGIFTSGAGKGQIAATNQDGSPNSETNPAAPGSTVRFYATGVGQTVPEGIDGAPATFPYSLPRLPVAVRIAGIGAGDIEYAGAAPGYTGVVQINVRIPEAAPPGTQAIEITVGEAKSQPGATLAIR
jgi:trimeric autotransporter adhesin